MKKRLRFAISIALVAAVVEVYRLLPVNATTVALSLLLTILLISARWGLAEAIVASVAAMLGFNYYFLPPVGTFTVADPENWVALAAFLFTAIVASQLSARARRRAAEAEARRVEIERLYTLLQAMPLSGSARKTIREFVNQAVQVFGCKAAAFYYRPSEEVFRSGPESNVVTDQELRTAAEIQGVSIDEPRALATAAVRIGLRPLGSLALVGALPSQHTIHAMADMAALTIEKARALEEAGHAEAARQSEMFKSAMLDSLAHDIKTPLTSIKAAVTSLLGAPRDEDRELLTIIHEETDRLNRLSAEMISMARVEAGKLHLEKRPVSVAGLIEGALGELAGRLEGHPVTVNVPEGLPYVLADAELAQQVVRQLVENAAKYSPAQAPIAVSVEPKNAKIVIGVADRGPGIEENERMLIFDKFFRGRQHRFASNGTGMGLAIAKGIVEAHGERIWVESVSREGSVFYFTLAAAPGETAP